MKSSFSYLFNNIELSLLDSIIFGFVQHIIKIKRVEDTRIGALYRYIMQRYKFPQVKRKHYNDRVNNSIKFLMKQSIFKRAFKIQRFWIK